MKATFPGFDSPAVGFEAPFEMLAACDERLRTLPDTWSRADAAGVASDAVRAGVSAFAERYAAHLQIEERIVFPAARSHINAQQLAAMMTGMQRRRRVTDISA